MIAGGKKGKKGKPKIEKQVERRVTRSSYGEGVDLTLQPKILKSVFSFFSFFFLVWVR